MKLGEVGIETYQKMKNKKVSVKNRFFNIFFDVRMVHLGQGSSFPLESKPDLFLLGELGREDLERDDLPQPGVLRAVDGSHSARPDLMVEIDFEVAPRCFGFHLRHSPFSLSHGEQYEEDPASI